MFSFDIPIKKPITADDFIKFNNEFEDLAEKYFGHSDIYVAMRLAQHEQITRLEYENRKLQRLLKEHWKLNL